MEQIEELFNEFEEKLLEISLYAFFITEESIKKYKEYLEKFSEVDFSKNTILDNNIVRKRLVYFDILNKHEEILSDSKIVKNANELLGSAEFHKNKQLQWLFVEAYELFEKYFDDLYNLIGNLANSDDFKKVLKNENKLYSIIEIFNKKFNLKQYDNINIPSHHYSFLINLLSKFRNAIVHHNGFIDKKVLSSEVMKNCGINGSDKRKKYEAIIFSFLDSKEYENMICLTKIVKANELIKNLLYRDRFQEIIGILISYIKLITDLSKNNKL